MPIPADSGPFPVRHGSDSGSPISTRALHHRPVGLEPRQHTINYNNIFLPKVPRIFVSPDDIVFQSSDSSRCHSNRTGSQARLGQPDRPRHEQRCHRSNDWRYTWMFTGRRSDATNGTAYEGDIVIFDNRPFASTRSTPTGPERRGGRAGRRGGLRLQQERRRPRTASTATATAARPTGSSCSAGRQRCPTPRSGWGAGSPT